jgi:EmrB/QacA subfamily drug resistance transporter
MTAIGTFMTPLDSSIVSVALPAIGPHLRLSYTEALWVQAAYLLVISILLIPVGRLADMHGPLRFYMMGTILFGLASIGAALSFSGTSLIVARSIQGAGGALMFSTSAAILTSVFPGKERGRVLGLNVMVAYLGLTLGPPVGGLIVSHTSWRWIFLLNVPVALLTLLVGWNLLPAEQRDRAALIAREIVPRIRRRIDLVGAATLGAMLVCFFLPLTFSPFWGWGSGRTVGLFAAAVVLFGVFVAFERRVDEPILDLNLVRRNRTFAAANAATLLNYVAVFGVIVFTAVFLEIVQGHSAERSGLILLAQPVLMAALSPFAGRLSDRVGSRALVTCGQILIAGGMVQLALLSAVSPTSRVMLALATVGVGMAGFSSPNTSAVMGSVPRSQLNVASGFLATMRFAGQGMSIAVLGAIAAAGLGPNGGRVILLGEAASKASAATYATGYRQAMFAGAGVAVLAAIISFVQERRGQGGAAEPSPETAGPPGGALGSELGGGSGAELSMRPADA